MPQPSTQDLQAPFDPTGYGAITGAQLLQLITGAYPGTNTGLVIVTSGTTTNPTVPDAITNPKWQKYLWLHVYTDNGSVGAFVWNPALQSSLGVNFQNWTPISQAVIPAGTIQGYMIAANTIPATAIVGGLTYSTIVGAPALAASNTANTGIAVDGILTSSLFNNSNFVWGVLQGVAGGVGTPTLAPTSIPSTAFQPQTIAGNATPLTSPITDKSITTMQLRPNTSTDTAALQSLAAIDPTKNISVPTLSLIGTPSATNYKLSISGTPSAVGDVLAINSQANQQGWVPIRKSILTLAEPVPTTDDSKFVQVDPTGTFYQLTSLASFGKLLQTARAVSSTSSFLAGSATGTQIIQSQMPAIRISGGSFVAISTKSGFMLDGYTSGSKKIPLAISFTPLNSNSYLHIRLKVYLINGGGYGIAAVVYSLNPANAIVTAGVITYVGTVGLPTDIPPMQDSVAGYAIMPRQEYSLGNSVTGITYEWLIKPAYAFGTTAYAAGTNMTIVAAVGDQHGDSIGINSSSSSAETPPFGAGAIASEFTIQEILP